MKKDKKSKIVIILIICICFIFLLIYGIQTVYGLFESNSKGIVKVRNR